MKLLVVSPVAPGRAHATNAAPVVLFELLAALREHVQGRVGFLRLARAGDVLGEDSAQGVGELAASGIEVLPPLTLPPGSPRRSALKVIAAPRLTDFYPDAAASELVWRSVASFAPDTLMVPWSEWVTALCSTFPCRKFAYYGNPDPKNWRMQAELQLRTKKSVVHYAAQRALGHRLEPLHLDVMRRYHGLGNVAANDAEYYRRQGHPHAFYLQNVWIDRLHGAWRPIRAETERSSPTIIVGSVGKVGGTANTLGLEVLGRDLLPALRSALRAHAFEIHVLGSGQPHPLIAPLLAAPEIKLRGFVPDIDAEIMAAPIFLCMNNASAYKVGHTRYLHAWSLGACVIAHRDAALSMPEMLHEQNCLLGGSAAEIADCIARAAADPGLRRRLGEAGYATFREHFLAPLVAPRIVEGLSAA